MKEESWLREREPAWSVSSSIIPQEHNIILFPDDTRRDVFETFKFMLRCSWLGLHDIAFVPYVPYPGAELYNQMVKDGRLPPLGEEYFVSLLTHSDISTARS